MLDERKEYEEYTCEICDQMPFRLSYQNLKNHLSGVVRAMTIIARHALFDINMDVHEVVTLLNAWCGFKAEPHFESDTKKAALFERIKDWLPKYLDAMQHFYENEECEKGRTAEESGSKANKPDQIQEIKAFLKSKKDAWNYSPFFDNGKKNDANAIVFKKIIADAHVEGPLKERVLTFEKDPFEALVTRKGPGNGNKKRYLRAVAAYCLLARDDKKKVHLNYPAFSNWMGDSGGDSKKTGRDLSKLTIKTKNGTEKLFAIENTGREDVPYPKLTLNHAFVEEYHPVVMTKAELETIPTEKRRKLIIFMDCGYDKNFI